jgi:BirA family transcriptional regulator, biotin operon repressor / biotin---[acetyl-CoA-carboxylase] ligase
MTVVLLELLRRHQGIWLGMEALQLSLRLPPQVIRQQLHELQQMGYEIESAPAQGFRLVSHVKTFSAEIIQHALNTQRVGGKILVYDTTDSTNDVAWSHVQEPGFDGLAVFAEQQRRGRGRLGRSWEASKGSSILLSVLLQSSNGLSGAALTLLAGVATAVAIETTCVLNPRIKWPNDVTLRGKKVAGTLVEARRIGTETAHVIGIGINCQQSPEDFPPELQATAISLRQLKEVPIDRLELAQELLHQLDHWLHLVAANGCARLHDEWLARCDDVGRRVTLMSNGRSFTGRIIDVTPEAGLLLQIDQGPIRVFDGATANVVPPPSNQ